MGHTYSVQSVGDFTISFVHPLVAGGANITFTGFKLEGNIIDADQMLDNSKVVLLIDGAISITNSARAGTIKLTCVKTSDDPNKGDVTAIANILSSAGDSQGGTMRVSFGLNGVPIARSFIGATLKRCKPLVVDGNDVPDYGIEFNYQDWLAI